MFLSQLTHDTGLVSIAVEVNMTFRMLFPNTWAVKCQDVKWRAILRGRKWGARISALSITEASASVAIVLLNDLFILCNTGCASFTLFQDYWTSLTVIGHMTCRYLLSHTVNMYKNKCKNNSLHRICIRFLVVLIYIFRQCKKCIVFLNDCTFLFFGDIPLHQNATLSIYCHCCTYKLTIQ